MESPIISTVHFIKVFVIVPNAQLQYTGSGLLNSNTRVVIVAGERTSRDGVSNGPQNSVKMAWIRVRSRDVGVSNGPYPVDKRRFFPSTPVLLHLQCGGVGGLQWRYIAAVLGLTVRLRRVGVGGGVTVSRLISAVRAAASAAYPR